MFFYISLPELQIMHRVIQKRRKFCVACTLSCFIWWKNLALKTWTMRWVFEGRAKLLNWSHLCCSFTNFFTSVCHKDCKNNRSGKVFFYFSSNPTHLFLSLFQT